jgi:hypothetical protein
MMNFEKGMKENLVDLVWTLLHTLSPRIHRKNKLTTTISDSIASNHEADATCH